MKNLLLILLLVSSASLSLGQTTDSLKIKLSKEWNIKGYERFGVIDEPSAEQKNDKVSFKPDNSCSIRENGKNYSGTWSIDKTKTYIMCSLSGGIKRNYKIISVKNKEAIIEYQTPDLIRTKYHLEVK